MIAPEHVSESGGYVRSVDDKTREVPQQGGEADRQDPRNRRAKEPVADGWIEDGSHDQPIANAGHRMSSTREDVDQSTEAPGERRSAQSAKPAPLEPIGEVEGVDVPEVVFCVTEDVRRKVHGEPQRLGGLSQEPEDEAVFPNRFWVPHYVGQAQWSPDEVDPNAVEHCRGGGARCEVGAFAEQAADSTRKDYE